MFEEPCALCGGEGTATEEEIDDFDEDAPFSGRTPDRDVIFADLEEGGEQIRAWGGEIEGLDFTDADVESYDYSLSGLSFRNCTFDRVSFGGLLTDCSFETCSFTGADFRGTVVKDATFVGGTFVGSQFDGADLRAATFRGVIDLTASTIEKVARFGEHSLDGFQGLQPDQVVQHVNLGGKFDDPDGYPLELAERAAAQRAEKAAEDDRQRRYAEGYGRYRQQQQSSRDRLCQQQVDRDRSWP